MTNFDGRDRTRPILEDQYVDTTYGAVTVTAIRWDPVADRHKAVVSCSHCGRDDALMGFGELGRSDRDPIFCCTEFRNGPIHRNADYVGGISGSWWRRHVFQNTDDDDPSLPSLLLTREQAWALFVGQGGRCAVTGRPLSFTSDDPLEAASLDRIPPGSDYSFWSVRWVCRAVNLSRLNLASVTFYDWMRRLVRGETTRPPAPDRPIPVIGPAPFDPAGKARFAFKAEDLDTRKARCLADRWFGAKRGPFEVLGLAPNPNDVNVLKDGTVKPKYTLAWVRCRTCKVERSYHTRALMGDACQIQTCVCEREWGVIDGDVMTAVRALAKRLERPQRRQKIIGPALGEGLTPRYLHGLFMRQNVACALTHEPFDWDGETLPAQASLDRIDNRRGYVRGNVQWVFKALNLMRWDLTVPQFYALARAVLARENIFVGCN